MNHPLRTLAAVAVLLLFVSPSRAGVRRLTFDPVEHVSPHLNRLGQAVWSGGLFPNGSTFQIGFWDGSTVQRLTDNTAGNFNPQLNDSGQVVWEQGDQIYLWDGVSSRRISTQPVNNAQPQINNQGQVVWRDTAEANAQIYRWDGSATRPLTHDPEFKSHPQINNRGQVAWLQSDGKNPGKVSLWSPSGVQTFPLISLDVSGPEINDLGQVLWWGRVDDDSRGGMALWDGSTVRFVPEGFSLRGTPRLGNSGSVAWPWLVGISLWNGSTVQSFQEPMTSAQGVEINRSDQLVWELFGQIRYWNSSFVQSLTPVQTGSSPEINDAGQVVWSGEDGTHSQVYLYTPAGPGSIDLLSPDPITGGDTATGIVTLTGPAPAGGAVVSLSSDRPEVASLPPRVTVPQGEHTATFPVTTHAVAATTPAALSASYDGAVWSTTVHVWHVTLDSLTLGAASLGGGVPFGGTVTLDNAAPAGGAVVTLTSSDPAAAGVPATVAVQAGEGSATFSGRTRGVDRTTPVTITAAYGGSARTAALQVRGGQPALIQLLLNPSHVLGGERATGSVFLDGVAPSGGTVVSLASSSRRVAIVPGRLVVPPGQRAASFDIRTFPVRADTTVRISAAANGRLQSATLEVARLPLASFTLTPASVSAGRSVTGTVQLTGPAPPGGAAVQISTSGVPGAPVVGYNPQVIVPEGATSATFMVDTFSVTVVTALTVTVSSGGQKLSAPLTLLPIRLMALTFEPARVVGPQPATGRVTLSGPAPVGGVSVALVGDALAARLPASVRVPEGATTATFPVPTSRVRTAVPVTAAASLGGITRTAALTILPPQPLSLVLRPERLTGGVAGMGTLYLRDPAPAGGAVVMLSTSDPAHTLLPAAVTVPAGDTAASFTVRTSAVGGNTPVILRAVTGSASAGAGLILLPVLPADRDGRIQVLDLPATDLAYDPESGRLYAGIPAQDRPATAPLSDSVTWLDPFTGLTGPSLLVGDDPGRLALSDDGRALYVAIEGGAAVRRVDVPAQSAGLRFTLGSDPNRGPFFVEDMAALPGSADAVAISRRNVNSSPRHEGVVIYDSGVPRPESTPYGYQGSNAIQFSGSPTRLYGANTEGDASFRRMDVEASGVTVIDTTPDLLAGIGGDIRFAGGLIVTTTGRVIDPEARAIVGRFPGIPDGEPGRPVPPTLVAADPAAGRVFFLVGSGPTRMLQVFDVQSFAPVGSLAIPGVRGTAGSLIRWGQERSDAGGGLAFRTDSGQLFLVRTPLVSAPALTLSLAPASVPGGLPASATVTLSAPARRGGVAVTLASDDPAVAAVPASVMVPAGARSAQFPIATTPVARGRAVPIHASAGQARAAARLVVLEPVLAAFTVTPNPLAGNGTGQGTVVLSGPAPAGGATVTLEAPPSPVASSVPPSVTVAAGAVQASFPITDSSSASGCGSDALLQATYGLSRQVQLSLLPNLDGPALDSPDAAGGLTVHGEFSTPCRLSADLTIPLSSDNPALVEVPPTVTFPASGFSVTFDIKTHPAASTTPVTIRASLPGLEQTVTLRVGPLALSGVSLSSTVLVGGSMTTGTVTLNGPAPAGGLPVSLSTDTPAALDLPATVLVPAGAATAPFSLQTHAVTADTEATIRATAAGQVRTAALKIQAVGLSLSRPRVFAGQFLLATLILPAPATTSTGQATFSSSDPSVVDAGGTTYVNYGETQISMVIRTSRADTPKTVVISATYGGTTGTATLEVLPVILASVTLPGQPVVTEGPLAGTYVLSGSTVPGRVTLNYPAPAGGVVVNLGTNLNDIITVPDKVTVPEGATAVDFPIRTSHYQHGVSAKVWGEVGFLKEALLLLLPAPLSFLPNPVVPGETATGILLLPAPAPPGGAVVSLSDTSGGLLSYASPVSVPAGQRVVSFPIRPSASGPPGPFTVTATYQGQRWSAMLTRSP